MAKIIETFENKLREYLETIKIICVIADKYNEKNVIFVTNDDEVYGFGHNSSKCLGLGDREKVTEPTLIRELCDREIITFAFGDFHALALTKSGSVYSWGSKNNGESGYETLVNDFKPKLIENLSEISIDQICCGSSFSLALSKSGIVYIWGNNCGIGSEENRLTPFQIEFPFKRKEDKIIAIAAGYYHSLALTDYGQVFSWGLNNSGKLGRGKICIENIPALIRNDECFTKIKCGYDHSLLLSSDGNIYAFGSPFHGQLGNGSFLLDTEYYFPARIQFDEKFIDIATFYKHNISVAQTVDGKYYYWGHNNMSVPQITQFKSMDDIFAEYFSITYEPYIVSNSSIRSSIEPNLPNVEISISESTVLELTPESTATESIPESITSEPITELTTPESTARKLNPGSTPASIAPESIPDQKRISNSGSRYSNEFSEINLVGEGAFGSVFKAKNIIEQQFYAIKKIPSNGSESESNKNVKELLILSRLRNDFIVRYYSAWRENSTLYIQTEFCHTTLKSAIEKINLELNKNEPNIFTRIGFYISSALSEELIKGVNYLHKQNPPIIHRDLKPQNILISDGIDAKFVKIADFGISTVCKLDGDSLTKYLGTDRYAAPEVKYGSKYGVEADIYSLGVILQELFNIDINEMIES
jgi:hypothetical protein